MTPLCHSSPHPHSLAFSRSFSVQLAVVVALHYQNQGIDFKDQTCFSLSLFLYFVLFSTCFLLSHAIVYTTLFGYPRNHCDIFKGINGKTNPGRRQTRTPEIVQLVSLTKGSGL